MEKRLWRWINLIAVIHFFEETQLFCKCWVQSILKEHSWLHIQTMTLIISHFALYILYFFPFTQSFPLHNHFWQQPYVSPPPPKMYLMPSATLSLTPSLSLPPFLPPVSPPAWRPGCFVFPAQDQRGVFGLWCHAPCRSGHRQQAGRLIAGSARFILQAAERHCQNSPLRKCWKDSVLRCLVSWIDLK